MKQLCSLFLLSMVYLLSACNGRQQGPIVGPASSSKQEVRSYTDVKRYQGDMVDRVYKNILDSAADLRKLQDRLDQLSQERSDSLAAFREYEQTSRDYYASARVHLGTITDSALRQSLDVTLRQSESAYEGRVAAHRALIDAIDHKLAALRNANEQLRILLTEQAIRKYQQDHLPAQKPLQGLSKELDRLQQQIEQHLPKKP